MKKNIEYTAPQIGQIIAVTNEVLCASYDDTVSFDNSNLDDDHLDW